MRPEDYRSLTFLAAAYRELDRPDDRLEILRRALVAIQRHLDANPEDARALYLGGGVLIDLGEEEEGLEWGRRALARDPEDPRVLYNLPVFIAEPRDWRRLSTGSNGRSRPATPRGSGSKRTRISTPSETILTLKRRWRNWTDCHQDRCVRDEECG